MATNDKREETKNNQPKNGKKDDKTMDLSEEDLEYKKNIDDMVAALLEGDKDIKLNSFNMIKSELTSSSSTMSSIPKPLKFLRLHYEPIRKLYESLEEFDTFKLILADFLAVLSIVAANKSETDTILSFVLRGTRKELHTWGQEFMRTLAGEIGTEYIKRLESESDFSDLIDLVSQIVPFLIQIHSENEAIDLLLEVEKLDFLHQFCNKSNYNRICHYLLASANYAADTDEMKKILGIAHQTYSNFESYANALRVAIKLNNIDLIKSTFESCSDVLVKKQLAFILARSRIYLTDLSDEINTIVSNLKTSDYFKKLARELDVVEPKNPEDIFKSHLEEKKTIEPIDSYKLNLASSIVSSLVNAGFGKENLLSKAGSDWINRNKDEGLICTLAGLGLVNLWDIECGPNELEKFMGSNETDPFKKAGYNLGLGIISSGVRDENEVASAVLTEQLNDKNVHIKISAILGLGYAYAGSQNRNLIEPLTRLIEDFSYGFEISAFCALSLGLIFLGSVDEEVISNLLGMLIARNSSHKDIFDSPFLIIYGLGMGLLCLGAQKEADLIIETTQIQEFSVDLQLILKTVLSSCAYAGTGNVLKVQELMQLVAKNKDEINPKNQSIAVICISLIALGEDIGADMVIRSFDHFLQYGDTSVKRAVSLAAALLNVSNPKVSVADLITKLCYDSNKEVSVNALFSLGLVAAGTNNSRLATTLRQLASYYSEDNNALMVTRIAQGFLHMGKGLLTLNPIHSHNLLVSNVGLAGILITILSFTENALILGKYQYLLYSVCLSINPRMVMVVDENLEPKNNIQLMVGTAVDTVGQSGNPRTITGFQVHNSPVLIAIGERCELSQEDYESTTEVLENIVIVKPKPQEQKMMIV